VKDDRLALESQSPVTVFSFCNSNLQKGVGGYRTRRFSNESVRTVSTAWWKKGARR
jgi:hypothetical protein